jgi:hypothetical protein
MARVQVLSGRSSVDSTTTGRESSCLLREILCAGSASNGPAAVAAPKPAKRRTCAEPPLRPSSANSTETRPQAARATEAAEAASAAASAAPDPSYPAHHAHVASHPSHPSRTGSARRPVWVARQSSEPQVSPNRARISGSVTVERRYKHVVAGSRRAPPIVRDRPAGSSAGADSRRPSCRGRRPGRRTCGSECRPRRGR